MIYFFHPKKETKTYPISAKEVVERILEKNGINKNSIVIIASDEDFYSSNAFENIGKIYLKSSVLNHSNFYSLFVAAHETSHALQHAEKNVFIRGKIKTIKLDIILQGLFVISFICYSCLFLLNVELHQSYPILESLELIFFIISFIFYFICIMLYILFTFVIELDANKRAVKYLSEYFSFEKKDIKKFKHYAFFYCILSYVLSIPISFLSFFSFVKTYWKEFLFLKK